MIYTGAEDYWYDGVDVFRENDEGWASAISGAKTWIQSLPIKA